MRIVTGNVTRNYVNGECQTNLDLAGPFAGRADEFKSIFTSSNVKSNNFRSETLILPHICIVSGFGDAILAKTNSGYTVFFCCFRVCRAKTNSRKCLLFTYQLLLFAFTQQDTCSVFYCDMSCRIKHMCFVMMENYIDMEGYIVRLSLSLSCGVEYHIPPTCASL